MLLYYKGSSMTMKFFKSASLSQLMAEAMAQHWTSSGVRLPSIAGVPREYLMEVSLPSSYRLLLMPR